MKGQEKNQVLTVLHVGKNHSVFDSRVFQKECISLASAGYTVTYLTSDAVTFFEGEKNGVCLRTLTDVKNPYRVKQFAAYLRQKKRIQKRYLEEVSAQKPDIVHFHEQQLGFLAKKLKKKSIKVIYDIHEDNAGNAGTYFKKYGRLVSGCMAYFAKRQERRIIKAADGVITATDHIADLLMPELKKKKWEVLYNYPILEETSSSEGENAESSYICYTGTMGRTRGLEKMFEALAWLNKDIKILMIGNIDSGYQKILEGIYPNVKFCGYLAKEKIQDIHRGAFAGMCVLANTPNIYYSLPIKLFEYMRDKLPVIASDFPIWKSIVEESKCGICVPNEIEAIGKAVDYLYTHQDEGRKMGENGRESIMKKYNWKKEGEKLIAFYNAVAERGKTI